MTDQKQAFTLNPGDAVREGNFLSTFAMRDKTIPWRVVLSPHKGDRSDAQNRLQWLWHTHYAKHHGYTKEQAYNKFKFRHCLPILLADPENEQLRRVWDLVRNDKEAVAGLVKAIHTSDLTTAQMAEALTEYDQTQAAQGCVFPDPQDLRREAL